ncbi:juvenile hormone esterase-like [Diabrotica virgifera virgifera]|uniref:Carboxylic ester hydrolase n=1 Tax=Diabrotica virgifera virgifera TaxID=50390 RepID=A0ABM5JS34_DIAVI|nr:juvenile hormone esterase-like [Diabrotica virgifera virgifera]
MWHLCGNIMELPKEPEPWDNILDTTKNTKICYQTISRFDFLKIEEDCLYINVYSPQKPGSDDLLPVLLWIHGGGLVNESSTIEYYGPKYIMDHGVVVVTFNYRLGPFGFLGTDDGVIPQNLGLKDQRFAIEWVNQNIHLFGGNPEHVVLVGESAGSLSVGLHLMGDWEGGKELFHGVIMQSGTPISGICTTQHPTEQTFRLGKKVDPSFDSKSSEELLQVLQSASAHDILWAGIPGGAVLESSGPFSYPAYQAFIDQNYKKVPVIIGFNSEEWLYLALMNNEEVLKAYDANPSSLVSGLMTMTPENRTIAGNLLKDLYTNNGSFVDDLGGYIRSTSDNLFTTSTCKQVELASEVVPYFFYQFSYKGELGQGMGLLPVAPPDVGGTVAHAEDLHYMWEEQGTNSDLSKYSAEDQLMLHRYVTLWTNFIKYLDPTPKPYSLLSNFTWSPSNKETLRYMNFKLDLEMSEHPRQYSQVKEIKEKYMEPPYVVFT